MRFLLAAAFSFAASTSLAQTLPAATPFLSYTCGSPEIMDAAAKARLASIQNSDGDLLAANRAIDLGKAVRAKALDGQEVDQAYKAASHLSGLAKAAKEPEIAELFRRVARDQLYRADFTAAMQRASWAAGLSDAARAYAYQILAGEGCGVDADNTSWIRNRISTKGWFTIGSSGVEADRAAFLLIQHADRDRAFQSDVLKVLEPLAARGETRAANFALLHDRVSVARKLPQRYGTQGRCTPSGWQPFDIEEPDQLDRRRSAVGLPTEAEYIAKVSKVCSAQPG
jgi:hypothetical protein